MFKFYTTHTFTFDEESMKGVNSCSIGKEVLSYLLTDAYYFYTYMKVLTSTLHN